ncbi:MAG: dicarboxylate/amino acid:cation symporter [Lentisphaeria bacterium]|nr:dicarboxylate/amino acid:cation symporter [Lentisphaeria bacterium]
MKLFSWYNRIPLVWRNLGAFVLGCLAGVVLYKVNQLCGGNWMEKIVEILSPFGTILVNMLKMIVIPIIFFSLIHGAASLPTKTFGKMGAGVCAWYFFTSLYAAVFGCAIALLFNPKLAAAGELAGKFTAQVETMQSSANSGSAFMNIILGLFANPFKALAEGNFLAIIVFSIMFGLAARVVMDTSENERTRSIIKNMLETVEALQQTIFKMIDWIMAYFPIGIFALTACNFAVYGISLFNSYFQVALCVICGIILMLLVCYPLITALICRVNPYPILWKLREPILTAFVTRSSAAALPVSLKTARNNLHAKDELSHFTLSLGATVNMDGVCIHLPVFAVLAANLFGFEITITQMLMLVIGVVFASVGAGGVPGGSIFLLFLVLERFNLTPGQTSTIIALALGINPLLDMFETACNVAGDNIGTFVVGKKLGMIETTEAAEGSSN